MPAALHKIGFPASRTLTPPTWSWMAYEGLIDFLEPPFGELEWQKENILSIDHTKTSSNVDQTTMGTELSASAREFDTEKAKPQDFAIIRDTPGDGVQSWKCIVMGRKKEEDGVAPQDARHYVLFVAPKEGSADVYERVGVGYMPGQFVGTQTPRLVKVR